MNFGRNRTKSQIGGVRKQCETFGRQVYLSGNDIVALYEIPESEVLQNSGLSSLIRKLKREDKT